MSFVSVASLPTWAAPSAPPAIRAIFFFPFWISFCSYPFHLFSLVSSKIYRCFSRRAFLASVGSVLFIVVLICSFPFLSAGVAGYGHYPLLSLLVPALWTFAPPTPASFLATAAGVPQGSPPSERIRFRQVRVRLRRWCPRGGLLRQRRRTVARRCPSCPRPCTGPSAAAPPGRGAPSSAARTHLRGACRGSGAIPGAPRSSAATRLSEARRAGPDESFDLSFYGLCCQYFFAFQKFNQNVVPLLKTVLPLFRCRCVHF